MQLSAPGVNVYGVTIPGTPAVIIGFNEQVAWGITNGIDDVKDWYKLRINADYTQYEFDGKWIHLPFNVEVIKRRGQETFYDTVYHTVHGANSVQWQF
jgi:penicillin amidase